MPELPEVETVRRGLAPVLTGQWIAGVTLARPDLRFPFPERFAPRLSGAMVEAVGRRGKYLLAVLSTGETLIVHLGMTGRLTVVGDRGADLLGAYVYDTGADPRHDHVEFRLGNGVRVVFNDPRRFGYMDLVPSAALDACAHFAGMGPEPLSDAFDAEALARALAGRRTPLKAALLDQAVVAGLGNIYVCEALHRSGLSPRRQARTVSAARAGRLAVAIREVLLEAVAVGGSTLRDFASADGAAGQFQETFRVYGREGALCPAPGCGTVVRRIVQSGRSTFYCGRCQR
jgi:formamidopyrimidine-DNA glycosylase